MMLPHQFPITCHTDFVGSGSIFVAITGQLENGINYIPKAIEKGATTIVVQNQTQLPNNIAQLITEKNIRLLQVDNPRKALSNLSAEYAGYPAKQLKIIGITGTKGKTTTAWILEHILKTAEYKTALIGTIYNKIGNMILKHDLTTPQPDYLHQFFKTCVEQQVKYVVMEVAAQALSLHRIDDIQFDATIFTNFAKEHGEFYATMDEYFAAKCKIFNHAKPGASIFINTDDKRLAKLVAKYPQLKTFGINSPADYQGHIEKYKDQLIFSVRPAASAEALCKGRDTSVTSVVNASSVSHSVRPELVEGFEHIQTPNLCGKYNVYNCLAALAVAEQLNIDSQKIKDAFASLSPIPGRMEKYILPNNTQCIIDYAHTPNSYEAVLSLLCTKTDHLIVVFGCGGSRDKEKRPILGFIAAHYANLVFLTSDNPRFEDPETIIQEIVDGIEKGDKTKIRIEIDRKKAIQQAYDSAQKNSIIVLLGKGRDEYQLIKGKKYHFSERKIIQRL